MAKQTIKNIKTGKKEKSNKIGIRKLLKKNKKLVILISIAALLLLLFAAYKLWLPVHFILTDDLVLLLEPQDKSLSIHYEEKPNVTFKADIKNSFLCDAYCSYEFRDISAKSAIDKGAFTASSVGKKFKKDFQLSVDRVGSGQKIYSFDIQCSNIKTWYCITNKDKRKRSAFVTLNYDISEYEKHLKDTLKDNITKLANELSAVDVKIQELNKRFFELGFKVNLNDIESDKEIVNNDYNAIVIEFKNLERVWSEQNYLLLSELFNKIYNSRILGIKQKISAINSEISNIVKRHNSIIKELNKIDDKLRAINETIMFLNRADKQLLSDHEQLLARLKEIKSYVKANTFSSYDFVEDEIKNINSLLENFEKNSAKIFMGSYLNGYYYLNLEKEALCGIKNICLNKTDFSSIITDSLHIDNNKINTVCLSFKELREIYEKENLKSEELIKNYDIIQMQNILENAKSRKLYIAKKIIFNEIKNITASNESDEQLSILANISKINLSFSEEIDYGGFPESEILPLMQISLSNDATKYEANYCMTTQILNLSEHYGNQAQLNEVSDAATGNFSSRIGINLTENYPVCCVFGECKRCCTESECKEDPLLYPVLFLHGHSLNPDNSPDFSLDAFNEIQAKLQEDGYISAGTITPVSGYSEIKEGEWGMSSMPISVKGSYYLVSYYNLGGYSVATQKSENIETYAIRLKELIDLLKFRTGRDKIIIIAHSMGGLVARSYLQIFGDSSVDKLIMTAVPNKGISGKISSYCSAIGEKKECSDMSENSIFIKKLNDPSKIPKNVKVYNIVGIGCGMGNETGDGIVVKKNAELEYAENYYINGTCLSLSETLHTQIRDIGKYPEVYEIIRSILKKS